IPVCRFGDFVRANLASSLNFQRIELAVHQSFHCVDGICRIRYRLAFGYLANQALTLLGKCNYRRSCPTALFIWDDLGDAAFQYRNARVRGAEVYSNNFPHDYLLSTHTAKKNMGLIKQGGLTGIRSQDCVNFLVSNLNLRFI